MSETFSAPPDPVKEGDRLVFVGCIVGERIENAGGRCVQYDQLGKTACNLRLVKAKSGNRAVGIIPYWYDTVETGELIWVCVYGPAYGRTAE